MASHTITLNVTTEQVLHLNSAISDILQCNLEAISSKSFEDELSPLLFQAEALNTFKKAINMLIDKDGIKLV